MNISNTKDERLSLSRARGTRLRYIRDALKLSRQELSTRYGLAAGTLKNWENARFGGLTEKGARSVLEAFRSEGVEFDIEWILFGKGNQPVFNNVANGEWLNKSQGNNLYLFDDIEVQISKEIETFNSYYQNPIMTVMQDLSMHPHFTVGDHLAGDRVFQDEIDALVDQCCIVQLADGRIVVRILKKCSVPTYYNLIHLNVDTEIEKASLYQISVISAAKVIWIRKPN